MKYILLFSSLLIVLASCGKNETASRSETTRNTPELSKLNNSNSPVFETPKLTDAQKESIAKGKKLEWKINGLSWEIPQDMKRSLERDSILTYRSPSSVTLVASAIRSENEEQIKSMFQKNLDSAVKNEKNNLIEQFRYMEINGIKGFEYIERVPNRDGWRRHQLIALRVFNGQAQFISVFCGAKAGDFDKYKDLCAAILYSMTTVR